MNDRPAGSSGLVRRPSGLIVPEALGTVPEQGTQAAARTDATDLDGRRRVVFIDQERRKVDDTIRLLQREGFALLVICRKCNQPVRPEGADTPDPGFGCSCSRIHWLRK